MIYFVRLGDDGPIKIGSTIDATRRFLELEKYFGRPLVVLKTIKGDSTTERAIHRQFAHLRLGKSEQFTPGADLLAFIGRPLLVSANPDAVEEVMPTNYDPDRDDMAVKIDRAIVMMAKNVATYRGVSVAELLSEMLRPQVERAYGQMMRSLPKE